MTADDQRDGSSPVLFLGGLLVFLGSGVLFLVDLVRGVGVLRSIGANAIGAAILTAWAAHDTLFDPDSDVATAGGAAGTALLLYGLYLLGTGAVVGVTGLLFHDRAVLGAWYLALAAAATVLGFLIFPTGTVVDEADESEPIERPGGDPATEESVPDSGDPEAGTPAPNGDDDSTPGT